MANPERITTIFFLEIKTTDFDQDIGPCEISIPFPYLLVLGFSSSNMILRFYLFIFRESGREGEREEKHQCVVASQVPPTGDLVCNPGMRPYWESNRQLFGYQACTQSTELHQPGQQHGF